MYARFAAWYSVERLGRVDVTEASGDRDERLRHRDAMRRDEPEASDLIFVSPNLWEPADRALQVLGVGAVRPDPLASPSYSSATVRNVLDARGHRPGRRWVPGSSRKTPQQADPVEARDLGGIEPSQQLLPTSSGPANAVGTVTC